MWCKLATEENTMGFLQISFTHFSTSSSVNFFLGKALISYFLNESAAGDYFLLLKNT